MKLIPQKSVLFKWLFTAVLILGFFTFSGFTIQTTNRFNKPDITLVTGNVTKTSRSISYKAASKIGNQPASSGLIPGYCNFQILSLLHSWEACIEIKQSSRLFITIKAFKNFSFIRAYCLASGDDLPFIA
ncbi:hypothetical protein [Mucilaginibacter gossypiicola]|nr:hypothetical protein [Mucilaginibacter gossypiicola]